ncbi:MAG: nickel pincer cofactor biosynthesis protein LarC [Bacillota bacterium]|nr:nickel pincer cofactor biosynthesis protein LarC [Clostridia bacterium]
MKTAYFHCDSGISGDMCIGALVHAGADFSSLRQQLSTLPLNNYEISYDTILKNNITAGKFTVKFAEDQPHRNLEDILHIINTANLAPEIKERSKDVFTRLAQAEAKVHGTTPDKIHFHEVGAVDSIIDIVGTVICLSLLKIEKIVSSPLPVGRGFVTCAHGTIPLPAPATREILKGVPQYGLNIEGELVTPTGAAIIATLAHSFGPLPEMSVHAFGFGAGTKDFSIPNILAVSIGEEHSSSPLLLKEEINILEACIDDMNPEFFSYLWDRVFSVGAKDMFITPVYMKKGRPGFLVTVLCLKDKAKDVAGTLLKETSTLGVRVRSETRFYCPRENIKVKTKYGEINVKVGNIEGTKNLAPEFEECKNAARKHQVPLKDVYWEAIVKAKSIL